MNREEIQDMLIEVCHKLESEPDNHDAQVMIGWISAGGLMMAVSGLLEKILDMLTPIIMLIAIQVIDEQNTEDVIEEAKRILRGE